LEHQEEIEAAAITTARKELQEQFSLVLYDVTTLYFESFKEYAFQKPGFSRDNKPIIVDARLESTATNVINQVYTTLPRTDKALDRFSYKHAVTNATMICEFSDARYKKEKREFDTDLQVQTEKLLGIKGYVTNIPEKELSSSDVIEYYHDLWNVKQAFCMGKSDLPGKADFPSY